MLKTHHLFIFPGLGKYEQILKFITRNWEKRFGIQVHLLSIDWYNHATNFQQKLTSLTNQIKPYAEDKSNIISLLGISAGASAVNNVWQKLEREGVNLNGGIILVCGRLREGKLMGQKTLTYVSRNSPAFRESVLESEKNLKKFSPIDRTKVLTFYSMLDELVPPADARIEGSRNIRIFSPEHIISIALIMTLYAKTIVDHIKNQ